MVKRTTTADVEKEEMKKQIEELNRQLQTLLAKVSVPSSPEPVDETDDSSEIEIRPDAYIKVMSLCPVTLNLTTLGRGQGKIFTFTKFGEVKRILYADLVSIMEAHYNFLEQGFFVILKREVVRRHGLDDIYAKILTKDKIDAVLAGNNQSDSVHLFESANSNQREFIVNLLADKYVAGEKLDLNLLDRMSRVVGYNIQERLEGIKISSSLTSE
jgi:hypothetical protein